MTKKYILFAVLILLGLSNNLHGLGVRARASKDQSMDDWNIFFQTSSAYRIYTVQGFEATWNIFINNCRAIGADNSFAACTNLNGPNVGFHAGYREVGLNFGYGDQVGFLFLLTSGWNASLTVDYIHNGNNDLQNNKCYFGIEAEGSMFDANLVTGVKGLTKGSNDLVFYVGAGLRF